jgi:hypothetical protein
VARRRLGVRTVMIGGAPHYVLPRQVSPLDVA